MELLLNKRLKVFFYMIVIALIIAFTSVSYAQQGYLLKERINSDGKIVKRSEIKGSNKTCYYNTLNGIYSLNIKAYEHCPLTVEFD